MNVHQQMPSTQDLTNLMGFVPLMVSISALFWLIIKSPKSIDAKEGSASLLSWIIAMLIFLWIPNYFQITSPAISSLQKYQLFHVPWGYWWSIPLYLLAGDLSFYINHRILHAVPILWTLHGVHHTGTKMNLVLILRGTFFPFFVTLLQSLPLHIIGFSIYEQVYYIVLANIHQSLCHTERNWPRFLDKFMITPAIHRVHHSAIEKHLNKNFGGILSIWDNLFKTKYYEYGPMVYGLGNGFNSRNPIKIVFYPLFDLVATIWKTKNPIYLFVHKS